MIKTLKDLAGKHDDTSKHGYAIMKYPHPDSGKSPEFVRHVDTLDEAQDTCSADDASFKEGDTENWWFLGYVDAGSRSRYITIW